MNFQDAKYKLGLRECVSHELLEPFIPLMERSGGFIVQNKFVCMINNNRPLYL
jgi:hypothetical protein